jgi:hypothetical protein
MRNPFRLAPAVEAAQVAESDRNQSKPEPETIDGTEPPELSPSELGFRLTATIVGSQVRMATINGKPYREQSSIVVASERGATQERVGPETAFTLVSVGRKHVVLERNGKLYQLELAR